MCSAKYHKCCLTKKDSQKMQQVTCGHKPREFSFVAARSCCQGIYGFLRPSSTKLFGRRRTRRREVIKKQNGMSHLIETGEIEGGVGGRREGGRERGGGEREGGNEGGGRGVGGE